MEKTAYLLDTIRKIINNYEENSIKSGERFNIFSILKLENNEVKTHSALLGELLNPKGSHGMKTAFLELFLNEVFENKRYLIPESTSINIEEHIGKINSDYTEGGRIDIILKDKRSNVILIENKIYAGEQKNQLIRYKNAYPNAKILFLTLFGNDSFKSEGLNAEVDYKLISYENHIINWLQKCLDITDSFPILKHTIQQYIILLKKLTNQTINYKMKSEIVEIIKENYLESYEIYRNFNSAKKNIVEDFINDFKKELIKKSEESWKTNDSCLIPKSNFNYTILSNNTDKCFFYFRYNNLDSKNSIATIGIILSNEIIEKKITGIDIYNELSIKKYKSGNHSVIYNYLNDIDFCKPSTIEKILYNKQEFIDEILEVFMDFINENTEIYNDIVIKTNNLEYDKNIN